MPGPVSSASFPGIRTLIQADITISRGVTPDVALVRLLPQNVPSAAPGTLAFRYGGTAVSLPDCLPVLPSLRKIRDATSKSGYHWMLQILDHRHRWATGSISGEFNVRRPDGFVDEPTRRTPQQLAILCLRAMGETGFDVSRMPNNVFPYRFWNAVNPAKALQSLCDYVACEVCGGEFGRVVIWPRGVGSSLPTGNATTPRWGFPVTRPTRIIVVCGGTWFQSKLLLRAVGRQNSGRIALINDLTYKPGNGWFREFPFAFQGVAEASRSAALETVLRWYRVTSQAEGGIRPPGVTVPVSKITQLFPLRSLLVEGNFDPDNSSRPLAAFVQGKFWPYSDDRCTIMSSENRYVGQFDLDGQAGIVKFPLPMVNTQNANSTINTEPTLYLVAAYQVRDDFGRVVGISRVRQIGGGGGDLVLRRPEIFDAVKLFPLPTGRTTAEAIAEAERYLNLFTRAYTSGQVLDLTYVGIAPIRTDGRIAQVSFSSGVLDSCKTRAGQLAEFDVTSPSRLETRRTELVEQFREITGL